MPSTLSREKVIEQRIDHAATRLGYALAVVINAVMVWVVRQLLDWEYPKFLTEEFNDLIPILTLAFVVSLVANAMYLWNDRWPVKPIGDMITAAMGFLVALRTYQVFPFDFSGYESDWSWLVRLVLIVAMVAVAAAFVWKSAKLAIGPPRSEDAR